MGKKILNQFTTVTSLSKLLAMILFIALPFIGFFFGMQFGKSLPIAPAIQIIEWKQYSDPDGYFSFEYPSHWRIDYIGHAQDDPNTSTEYKQKKDIVLSSTEGKLELRWVESYGGGCGADYTKIQLKNEVLDVCHDINGDQEIWWQIGRPFEEGKNLGFQLDVTADPPASKNREIVLRMLSSFEIHKK